MTGEKVPQAVAQLPWSRDSLIQMIKSNAFERQGSAVSNFNKRLPETQSNLAQQTLKDPYVFDFLTLSEPFKERELETELLKHLEKFLIGLQTPTQPSYYHQYNLGLGRLTYWKKIFGAQVEKENLSGGGFVALLGLMNCLRQSSLCNNFQRLKTL